MTTDSKIYSKSWLLTPGECNCEKEMPVWLMTERIIDVATEHANSWGVGYARLILDNQAWVLSRVAIEMKRWPKVNETYTLSTWVEDYNRHFSERNIEVTDTDGSKRTLRTVGDKWSYLQSSKFGANAQPFYVAVDADGNPLTGSFSFKEDVPAYLDFLNKGLEAARK